MKTTRSHDADPAGDRNRYYYDFGPCHFSKGWAQLDTAQDASYFGNWINPITLRAFSYCEGDLTTVECESEAEFVEHVREAMRFYRVERGETGAAIDGMCSERIIEALKRMGLGEFLHSGEVFDDCMDEHCIEEGEDV